MMLPSFNKKKLLGKLIKLDNKRQLAFGVSCCERILPNYLAFQKNTGWGNIKPIRKAINLAWSSLSGNPHNPKDLKQAIIDCENVTPKSEDFVSFYADLAQDVCFAVYYLLDYLLENDINKIIYVATYATDSVDLYVQEIENMAPNDPELEQKILNHKLMQRELAQQEKELNFIEGASTFDHNSLSQIKELWDNNGKSNLDLP